MKKKVPQEPTQPTAVKGYKVFNADMTCRDFQFEVGKEYKHKGEIKICSAGFHFCLKANDCFNYYDFNPFPAQWDPKLGIHVT